MDTTADFSKYPDPEGVKQLVELTNRVAPRWKMGTSALLKERNHELLDKINSAESRVNSLLLIADKPKDLKKKLASELDEYEKAINLAIAYAARHQLVGAA